MLSRLRRIWLPLVAGLCTGLALVLSVSVLLSTNDLSHRTNALATHNCRQLQQVYTRIQTVVIQGDKTLGRPGSPGYAYYLAHPTELAAVHRSDAHTIRAFTPQRCR